MTGCGGARLEDWSKFSEEQVFTRVGEEPGSPASYWRDTEIRRREYPRFSFATDCELVGSVH